MTLMTPKDLRADLRAESDNWARLGHPGPRLMLETVLHAGVDCIAQPLPYRYKRGWPKMCFANAAKLARRARGKLTYVEGYALRPDISLPMHHAWTIDSKGRVVDPTWETPEDCTYVGVPIPIATYNDLVRRGKSASAFDGWRGLRIEFLLKLNPALADLLGEKT
jgi:hypothetical protein